MFLSAMRKKLQIISVLTYFLLILMINGERNVIASSFTPYFKTSSFEYSTIYQSKTHQFDDCSTDFQHSQKDERPNHQPMEYICTNTINNNYFCMVNKCPSNFYDGRIAHFCQTSNGTEILMDFRLSIPVTSQVTNITYTNVFCAYCNDERNYKFWEPVVYCTPKYNNMTDKYNNSHKQTILSNLKVDGNRGVLISNINNTMFKCSVHGLAPSELRNSTRNCTLSSNYLTSNLCKDNICFSTSFYHKSLPRFIEYDYTNPFIDDDKVYFKFKPKFLAGDSKVQKQSCFPARDKTICTTGQMNKDRHFQFINKETIFFNETGTTFGPTEWSDTFDKNVIFLCQTAIKQADYTISYTLIMIIEAFSIIFFFLLLWTIGTNRKKRQSLPNKVIFAYSLTMLMLQLTTSASFWLRSCKAVGPIMHYLRLSRYVWLSILAFDCWRMIYQSVSALKQIAMQPHLKRFSIYCLIGWISPLSILSVALYLELANRNDTSCSLRPEYGRLWFCRMTQEKAIDYFENYPVYVASGIIIISFVSSVYYINIFTKSKYIESRKKKDNFRILLKLAWTMGLAFVIAIVSAFFQDPKFRLFFNVFDQSQGLILYLIHGRRRFTNNNR